MPLPSNVVVDTVSRTGLLTDMIQIGTQVFAIHIFGIIGWNLQCEDVLANGIDMPVSTGVLRRQVAVGKACLHAIAHL